MRDGWEQDSLYLAMDCGPFGYPPALGHGHADALSVEVYGGGRPLLVDSGVYSFHLGDEWRNEFRSTRAHNTVVVDGLDQSELLDGWRVWRPASADLVKWIAGAGYDLAQAFHDGYRRLPGQIVHWRTVFFVQSEYWILIDHLEGRGVHRYELIFHLPPGTEPLVKPDAGLIVADDLVLAYAGHNDIHTYLSTEWVSFHSGVKVEAPVVVQELVGKAPMQYQTVLLPVRPGLSDLPTVTPLAVHTPSQTRDFRAFGLRLDIDGRHDIFMLNQTGDGRTMRAEGIETDGSVAYLSFRDSEMRPDRVVVTDSTFVVANGEELFHDPTRQAVVEKGW
jgi:hypothetical protein